MIEAVLRNEQPFHVEVGDVLDGLRKLPDGCLHCVVTSPPYWALRSYLPKDHADKAKEIGSEPTPAAFVQRMVEIFREVHRVLRDDGTLFLNLGDNYATAAGKCFNPGGGENSLGKTRKEAGAHPLNRGNISDLRQWGVSDGSQMLMPHRVAMALQDDGWCLRSTIISAKKSPMPESISGWRWRRCRVKICGQVPLESNQRGTSHRDPSINSKPSFNDGFQHAKFSPCPGCPKCLPNGGYVLRRGKWRPTTAHEYIFLFTKGGDYFCDGDAAQEAATSAHLAYRGSEQNRGIVGVEKTNSSFHDATRARTQTRNPRTVWNISSEPEKARHFAVFPSAIPRKCLTAATSKAGCCPKCGACYAPVVESQRVPTRPGENTKLAGPSSRIYQRRDPQRDEPYKQERFEQDRKAVVHAVHHPLEVGNRDPQRHVATTNVTGYRPTCDCNAGEPIPCLVADIFSGSGTTGRVAYSMGLRYIGLELSEEYAAISREKIVRPFPVKAAKATRRPTKGQLKLFA